LSPSLAVDPRGNRGPNDPAGLSWLDVALAAVLHLALLGALLAAGMWHPRQTFHPRVVTVHMVQPPVHHHQPKRHVRKPPKARPKPRPPKKAAIKPRPHARPVPEPKARLKPKAEPFDPFKPLESPDDVNEAPSAPVVSPSVRELQQRQLSAQELNRYIARIQAAVQKHWKVPAHIHYEREPLVQMTLNPNGSVQSVRIIESSGNEALDASLTRAIRAASPFSIPREQFEVFRDNKIRFHPLR